MHDDGSAAGDILRLDVTAPAQEIPGYRITNYEVALSQRNGAVTTRRMLGGPATVYPRRFRTDTPGIPQRVQLRTVWQRENQIVWNSKTEPLYRPVIGDPVFQPDTGASATVRALIDLGYGSYYLVLGDITDIFTDETEVTVAGNTGNQSSIMHCTHLDAEREVIVSEWSLPRDVTPGVGAPTVQVTASKTTCLQGEAVIFEAQAFGFESERPIHDLSYRFFVEKPGEQGVYAALPDFFDSCFGAGSNNRAEGCAQVWAFAPRTTGTVRVNCEVRDTSGNVATGFVDITSQPPVQDFPEVDIYAASSSLTPVPGAPGANVFATLDELVAALPFGGQGLILLDTAELHSPGDFGTIFLQDKLSQRCAIMPYNAGGVGPAAGARARMNRSVTTRAGACCLFGLDLIGPFDPADPFSVAEFPEHGYNGDLAAYSALAECTLTGWRENVKLPITGNEAAYVDLYSADYHNFGFFGGGVGKHAMSGCYTFTNPRAWRAGGKGDASDNSTDGFFVDHGPYRSSRPDGPRGFSKSVFFSCCSWGGTGYPQPPLRLFGNGATPRPEITHGAEIITEGGSMSIDATTRGGGDTTVHPQDVVWDKFFHITSMQPLSAMTVGMGGVTVRNGVIATSSNAHENNSSGLRHHIGIANRNSVPGQNDSENNPIEISFVSIIDLRVDSGQNTQQMEVFSISSEYPMKNVSVENLLTYAPNFTLSDTGAVPVDTTPRWTPLYEGQYWWDATIVGTNAERLAGQTPNLSFATPPEVTASFEPGPGSNAYRTATGKVPYDDIRSRARPVNGASRGAYDPDAV